VADGRAGRGVRIGQDIRSVDWVIELGPAAGAKGGTVIAQGPPGQLEGDPRSIMGQFLAGAPAVTRDRPTRPGPGEQITLEIRDLYNLHDVTAAFPVHRASCRTARSGNRARCCYPMPSRVLALWSRMARAASGSIWGSLM
jgi:hypothetical protein